MNLERKYQLKPGGIKQRVHTTKTVDGDIYVQLNTSEDKLESDRYLSMSFDDD